VRRETPEEPRLRLTGAPPRIVALERLIEAEHIRKVEARVGGLADEEPEIDQREHDVAEIGGGPHAPVVEHETRHHSVPIEREVAARFRQLATRDVPTLRKTRLRELEGRKNEQVRVLMEPRLAQANLVHDTVSKRQLRQC